jgi:hypothetical protein
MSDNINAPLDAEPDASTTSPDRYVVVEPTADGDYTTPVYCCHDAARGGYYVIRTYLRDKNGVYTDPRYPASAIATDLDDAEELLENGTTVAMPVTWSCSWARSSLRTAFTRHLEPPWSRNQSGFEAPVFRSDTGASSCHHRFRHRAAASCVR